MTDEEYIRKAVELADGWSIRSSQYGEIFGSGDSVGGLWARLKNYDGVLPTDALAAQLVRQVDAKEMTWIFSDGNGRSAVHSGKFIEGKCTWEIEGPDRTMNTIKAIVDSGVLE